jgi:hypothetical protein
MAEDNIHIAQANRNQDVMTHLAAATTPYHDWVATAAFYKAVHVVEAVFYHQEPAPTKHATSHKDRNYLLKKNYSQIWRNYRHLLTASLVARYLEYQEDNQVSQHSSFMIYMPPNVLRDYLLGHCLVQVETSAVRLLANPQTLQRYVTGPAAPAPTPAPPGP